MARLEMSERIGASRARVWQALCDPDQVAAWDPGVEAALDAPPDYPRPGQEVRWRLPGGGVLLDRPFSVKPSEELASVLNAGRESYREVYSLSDIAEGTLVRLVLEVRVDLPLLGGAAAQLWARPRAMGSFRRSLQELKRFCEQ